MQKIQSVSAPTRFAKHRKSTARKNHPDNPDYAISRTNHARGFGAKYNRGTPSFVFMVKITLYYQ
ncbi:MAG: hypothetical protein WC799_19280 [Desulfobacteraceae bacterium]